MKPRWSRNLDETAAKELKGDYLAAYHVRKRLIDMLNEDIQKSLKEMRNASSNPEITNLPEYYADALATQRTLEEVINLITD